jgi:hypothetical protein
MTQPGDVLPWTTVEELFDAIFECRPARSVLEVMRPIERERPEVRAFVTRWLRLMARARIAPRHIAPPVAWALGSVIPHLLPGAWGNIVPPFTLKDRHVAIDEYLRRNPWTTLSTGTTMLEMGCGFPPQTVLDIADRFPDWQITGADARFEPFVLHDAEGNYACIDADGRIRYFHPHVSNLAMFEALYRNPETTFRRFRDLFARLAPRLPRDDGSTVSVEEDGATLTRHPIRALERPRLRFVQAAIGEPMPRVDVLRIFNVLMYFDRDFRTRTERWALDTLRPGGLFLCGANFDLSMESRYSVYQQDGERLVAREFAFSIDNVRPLSVMPWFSLHDDERDTSLLARLVGMVRSDETFGRDFDARCDDLLATHRLWIRNEDGSLAAPANQRPPTEWVEARLAMTQQLAADGYVDRAVTVLQRAGLTAWNNVVGHVAVDPLTLAA